MLGYVQGSSVHYESSSIVSVPPSYLSIVIQTDRGRFPPVLHEWFVEMFPDTGTWFAARLRYTRTCAVMSIVGYVLG